MTKILSLLFTLTFLFGASQILAQGPTTADPFDEADYANSVPSAQLAGVAVSDLQFTATPNGGTVSATLANLSGVQPGVRYGVAFFAELVNGRVMLSESLAAESLTLVAGQPVSRTFPFTTPPALSGDLTADFVVRSEQGLYFSSVTLGKVSLDSTNPPVSIDPQSCYLTIRDSSQPTRYLPTDYLTIVPNEDILLSHCQVTNHTAQTIDVTPSFETFRGTTFTDAVAVEGADYDPVMIPAGETISVVTTLPTLDLLPGRYLVRLAYGQSNPIVYQYVVPGVAATISSVTLDAATYTPGDTAVVTVIWSGMSDASARVAAGTGRAMSSPTLMAVLLSQSGVSCGESGVVAVNPNLPLATINVPITADCGAPTARVTFFDANHPTLAEVSLSSNPATADQAPVINQSSTATNSSSLIILVVTLFAVIVIFMLLLKLRAKPTLGLFVLLTASYIALSASAVEASTGMMFVPGEGEYDTPQNFYVVNASLNKSDYAPGEMITISGNAYVTYQGGSLTLTARVNALAPTQTVFNNVIMSMSPFSNSGLVAPATPGAHYVRLYGRDNNTAYGLNHVDLKFNVIEAPPDVGSATCRWELIPNPLMNDHQEVRDCSNIPPSHTPCTAPYANCGFNGGWFSVPRLNICDGVSSGDSSLFVNGYMCMNSLTTNHGGVSASENSICYAQVFRTVCDPPPATPTGLSATAEPACGSGVINVSWNSSAGATVYYLEINGTERALTGTSFADTGLAPGTNRTYRVRAVNNNGTSDWSASVTRSSAPACASVQPDLQATAAGASGSGHIQGISMTLTGTVRNAGSVSTGVGFTSTFRYQWGGTAGSWLAFPSNSVSRGALGASAEVNQSVSFTPGQSGNLYVQYCVDSTNAVAESNELNNCRVSGAIAVGPAVAPTVQLNFRP